MNFDLEDVMTSRGVLIHAIIAEDPSIGRELNHLKEVFDIVHLLPSLPLDANFALDAYEV